MASDPFPNTGTPELEYRMRALFGSSGSILTAPVDPLDKKEGLLWVNTTDLTLKIYLGGKVWSIGTLSALD